MDTFFSFMDYIMPNILIFLENQKRQDSLISEHKLLVFLFCCDILKLQGHSLLDCKHLFDSNKYLITNVLVK